MINPNGYWSAGSSTTYYSQNLNTDLQPHLTAEPSGIGARITNIFLYTMSKNIHARAWNSIYCPDMILVEVNGIEPMTSGLQSRRSPN